MKRLYHSPYIEVHSVVADTLLAGSAVVSGTTDVDITYGGIDDSGQLLPSGRPAASDDLFNLLP